MFFIEKSSNWIGNFQYRIISFNIQDCLPRGIAIRWTHQLMARPPVLPPPSFTWNQSRWNSSWEQHDVNDLNLASLFLLWFVVLVCCWIWFAMFANQQFDFVCCTIYNLKLGVANGWVQLCSKWKHTCFSKCAMDSEPSWLPSAEETSEPIMRVQDRPRWHRMP